MLKRVVTTCLLVTSLGAQANELQDLVNASRDIVNQIDRGVMLTGAVTEYSYTGTGLSDGTLSESAHISKAQLEAYNSALSSMSNYLPYGDMQAVLEEHADAELELLDQAIEVFTEATVEMVQVIEVAERAESASSPNEEAEVQNFVAENQETLQITQEEVDAYNQSLDDIEVHANNASAYLAVAGNEEAVSFLEQGVKNANTTAEQTNIFYDANAQWLAMGYNTTRNLTAVYLNGQNFGLDLYATEADILELGSESEFYLTGPTVEGYRCFMYGECD